MSATEPARRPSSAELVHDVAVAALSRAPAPAEHTIEIGTTAKHGSAADPQPKRMHTWTITVRGTDADEIDRVARRLDDALAEKYADELATNSTA